MSQPKLSPLARTLLGGAIILLACILAYQPVLHGKFLWDDLYLVGSNPFFKSPRFVLEVFRHWLFLDSFSLYYRPVQNLSYILDYVVWNREEFGYHLSNVLFHAASAFLLYLVIRRCLRAMPDVSPAFAGGAAFAVGLLWAVHPIHNAAVAYVAGRADSIAMMFALAGWLLFLNEGKGWRRGVALTLAPLCILTALCAKEIAFIWIALFAIYLFGFEQKLSLRAKAGAVGSLLAVFGVYLWLRHLPGPRVQQLGLMPPPFLDRVLLMFRALGDYTSLIFYPGNLHMERIVWAATDYKNAAVWQQHLRPEYLSLIGLATIALFVIACRSRLPGRKIRILGVTWFVLGFLPISNLFPLNAQVAEHWIYMASAGFLLMLAGFAYAIPPRFQRYLAIAVPVLAAALGVRTAFRAADWADPETFYRQTIASGGFTERVSLNLADVVTAKGKLAEAESILRSTVAQFPGYPPARIQLGINLLTQGRKPEAEQYLSFTPQGEKLIAATTPQSWHAELNLASIRYQAHQPDAALNILDDAIRQYPGIWELIQYRAEILQATKGPGAALPSVADFAARNWWHFDSHMMLARLHAAAGDYTAALADCREAATLDIHSAAPYDEAAKTSVLANQFPQALEEQSIAIDRGPARPGQYLMLAGILSQLHEPRQALLAAHMAELLRASGTGG
ncbi:MAG TPA: tetratricopeptide repeat protein [Chthoniobacteraceae bacterium]|jgi:tetratricopeptide (TPR) repeat protein|nr:tetratricopeptide repeat protein [Chthoniobacteraceae bacterium]